ncbi:hypothetical protein AWC32_21580 [Mycobacterium xenopi]|uniref:Head-to-tail stopper n=1 Tax=Mycobacterium xenopi TaxID=1789 RepID=A0AAD1GZQ8_MYCXE|nr:hypothetical protein AWC32_21580 [Mycobacterium xenopi]BBU22158.1 hypothetical protein MYXE_19480 [Mycobacterium xenopi]SPX78024.1 Uncharacterised protein [Mycobacterium xenopi]
MSFGGQTVTFVTLTDSGNPNRLGMKPQTSTEVPVAGCLFRPLSVKEVVGVNTDIATEIWKCTAPPVPAALAAKASGQLQVDGETYEIMGDPKPHPDLSGAIHHVTIMCQKQAG